MVEVSRIGLSKDRAVRVVVFISVFICKFHQHGLLPVRLSTTSLTPSVFIYNKVYCHSLLNFHYQVLPSKTGLTTTGLTTSVFTYNKFYYIHLLHLLHLLHLQHLLHLPHLSHLHLHLHLPLLHLLHLLYLHFHGQTLTNNSEKAFKD